MSRITHFKQQPINIEFWDYYILCQLNSDVAMALQRMEYWDGTKDNGNSHAENINDATARAGQPPTQDTSNWIYKSQDELQWELLGIAGEKRLTKIINFLVDTLKYLDRRNNPLEGWDRTKQYEFKASLLQEQINYLGYIIAYFNLPTRHLRPVFYAIEVLTHEKIYIDTLSVDKVLEKIEKLKDGPKTPHFLKGDLEKFEKVFVKPPVRPFRTFAEWKAHMCGMESAETRNASGESAECIPRKCGSNTIENTYKTNREDKQRDNNYDATDISLSSQSTEDLLAELQRRGALSPTVPTPGTVEPPHNDAKIRKDLLASASPEVQALINEWKVCCGKSVRLTRTLIDHAKTLAGYQLPPGELASIVQRMRAKDKKGWYEEHGLHLGNVVNEVEKQSPERAAPINTGSQQGPTETDLTTLEDEIKREYPDLFIMPHRDDSGLYLVIWHGQGQEDFVLVRDSIDWQYWREDEELMDKAVAYGESLGLKNHSATY